MWYLRVFSIWRVLCFFTLLKNYGPFDDPWMTICSSYVVDPSLYHDMYTSCSPSMNTYLPELIQCAPSHTDIVFHVWTPYSATSIDLKNIHESSVLFLEFLRHLDSVCVLSFNCRWDLCCYWCCITQFPGFYSIKQWGGF